MYVNVKIAPVENKIDHYEVEFKAHDKEPIKGIVEKSNIREIIGTLDNAII